MKEPKIIHVRLREPAPGYDTDYYFGSLAAIYDVLPEQAVGIRYDSLVNSFTRRGGLYENPRCVIRQGILHRKRQKNNPYARNQTGRGAAESPAS